MLCLKDKRKLTNCLYRCKMGNREWFRQVVTDIIKKIMDIISD